MMDEKKKLRIGHKIYISKVRSKAKKAYPSQILDVLDDDILIVSGPMYKRGIVLVHKGEIVEISYLIEDKGKYSFKAKVLGRDNRRMYRLKLKKVSDIKRVQLRSFYRFDVDIPVKKEFVIERDGNKKVMVESCRSQNISGGGIKLYSNYEHQVGDQVLCKFTIDNHRIITRGEIVRIEKVDIFYFKYGIGVKFIEIKERDRDKIIKFIFQKQRELREKGLI